jgi:predicted DNA-binding protein (MmcQ/YjbR family)
MLLSRDDYGEDGCQQNGAQKKREEEHKTGEADQPLLAWVHAGSRQGAWRKRKLQTQGQADRGREKSGFAGCRGEQRGEIAFIVAGMNAERLREFLLTLPNVVESEQWGGLVFWVGDKAIGGKMFAMMNLDAAELPISYSAGPERFFELQEREGIRPAPYFARIHWVAVERWEVFRMAEWQAELTAARAIMWAKLPPKTKGILAMPKAEQKKIVAERRKVLAAKKGTATADQSG